MFNIYFSGFATMRQSNITVQTREHVCTSKGQYAHDNLYHGRNEAGITVRFNVRLELGFRPSILVVCATQKCSVATYSHRCKAGVVQHESAEQSQQKCKEPFDPLTAAMNQ